MANFWSFFTGIVAWTRSLFKEPVPPAAPSPRPFPTRRYVSIARFAEVTADPPPMHWAPCHTSAIRRFKASMTCPEGHGLTLRGHTIAENGEVSPSVVCPVPRCHFHEFVRLRGWSFGRVD
jgi:hypothetical protein